MALGHHAAHALLTSRVRTIFIHDSGWNAYVIRSGHDFFIPTQVHIIPGVLLTLAEQPFEIAEPRLDNGLPIPKSHAIPGIA